MQYVICPILFWIQREIKYIINQIKHTKQGVDI